MTMKVSIYHWGGEPIRILSSGAAIHTEDRELLKDWAKQLSDPGRVRDEWLPYLIQGTVWIEGSSNDRQRRILLRPFYKEAQGVRPQWSFCGFAFPICEGSPARWAAILHRLLDVREVDLANCEDRLTLDDVDSWNTDVSESSPLGRVFRGPYADALDTLCNSLAVCNWTQLGELHIACHPPSTIPKVTALVLSDEFPFQNIRLLPGMTANPRDGETSKRILPLQDSVAKPTPPPIPRSKQEVDRPTDGFLKNQKYPMSMLIAGLLAGNFGSVLFRDTGATAKNNESDGLTSENDKLHQIIGSKDSEIASLKDNLKKFEGEKPPSSSIKIENPSGQP